MMSFKYYLRDCVANCIPERSSVLTFFLWFVWRSFQEIGKFNRWLILITCLCDCGKVLVSLQAFFFLDAFFPLNIWLWQVHWMWLFCFFVWAPPYKQCPSLVVVSSSLLVALTSEFITSRDLCSERENFWFGLFLFFHWLVKDEGSGGNCSLY